jgi:hypothetical protein
MRLVRPQPEDASCGGERELRSMDYAWIIFLICKQSSIERICSSSSSSDGSGSSSGGSGSSGGGGGGGGSGRSGGSSKCSLH